MSASSDYAFDLTVITVCWNAISTLPRCIQSVAPLLTNSDGLRVEYLIVDGKSTDGTVDLLEAALQQGKISRYISEPDKGIYDAMNKATRLAKGRICVFINADDEICADAAKACCQPILEGRARYTAASAITMKNNAPSGVWVPDMKLAWLGVAYCHQSMYCECSLLLEYGGFDTSYKIAADAHMINSLYRDKVPFQIVSAEASRFYLGGASTVNLVVQREQLRVMFAFADVILAHCTNDSDYAQFALKKIMHRINAANMQRNDDQIHQEKEQMINLHEKIAATLPINLRKKMRKAYMNRCRLYKILGICSFCSPKSAKKKWALSKTCAEMAQKCAI